MRERHLVQLRKEVLKWSTFLPYWEVKEIADYWIETGEDGADVCDLTHIVNGFMEYYQVKTLLKEGLSFQLKQDVKCKSVYFSIHMRNISIEFHFARVIKNKVERYECMHAEVVFDEE